MNDLKFTTAGDFVADAKGIPTEEKLKEALRKETLLLLLTNLTVTNV